MSLIYELREAAARLADDVAKHVGAELTEEERTAVVDAWLHEEIIGPVGQTFLSRDAVRVHVKLEAEARNALAALRQARLDSPAVASDTTA